MRVVLCIIFFFPLAAFAQNLTRTGIAKIKALNTGVILKQGTVKGYYYFYNVEKKDKKNNNYLLSVVDENLHEVNSINIVRPSNYTLIESAYNEQVFVFMFFDPKQKRTELISYDNSLVQVGALVKPIKSPAILGSYQNIALGNEAQQRYLLPVEGDGFILYESGGITYYDNALKSVWDSSSKEKNSNAAIPSEGFISKQWLGSIVSQASGKDIEYDLLVNDLGTGELKFQAPMRTELINVIPNDVSYDSANQLVVIFGEYFDAKDKTLKAQSLGFCYLMFDLQGKLSSSKTIAWADISQRAPVNKDGKFDGLNSNILFHEFIHTADGQIFAIGEQYKKVASGAGIGLQVLQVAAMVASRGGYYARSSSSSVQMNVYNMVVFQFNADYTLNKVHLFEKNKSQILLPSGSTYMSSKLLSYYVKARGGFDYRFSQLFPGKETFAVVYLDALKQSSKIQLGAIVYTPEKVFTVDKIDFDRKSSDFAVTRAKAGYVLIAEYFRKEKKFDMRLEKINY